MDQRLYYNQNMAIRATPLSEYTPLPPSGYNYAYERLFYYRWQTGSTLSFEDVQVYLSSEFELDGSVRIYNNGNWPEIQNYVEWALEHLDDLTLFGYDVIAKKFEWEAIYPLLRVEYQELSLHNLNEILLTMQDETYEPNFIFE